MLRPFAAALGLAMALATTVPASAQVETPQTDQGETQLVGSPVFSSDGQQLGQVIQVAMSDGQLRAVRAELGDALGIGTATVVIGAEVLERKSDRLEITMTAGQVKDVLVKQQQRQQQQQQQ
jgi:hypothetical protein